MDKKNASPRSRRQAIVRSLHDCVASMNARSLDTSSGFSYDRVRKTLQHVASIPPLLTPAWSTTLPPTPAPLRQNTLRQLSQVSLPTWWSAPNDQTTGSVPPVRTTPEAGLQIHSEAGSPAQPSQPALQPSLALTPRHLHRLPLLLHRLLLPLLLRARRESSQPD